MLVAALVVFVRYHLLMRYIDSGEFGSERRNALDERFSIVFALF